MSSTISSKTSNIKHVQDVKYITKDIKYETVKISNMKYETHSRIHKPYHQKYQISDTVTMPNISPKILNMRHTQDVIKSLYHQKYQL